MKILFLLLITAFSNSISPAHDMRIAKFHITELEATIQINMIFDLEDLSKSLDVKVNEVTVENIQNYLDKNTNWQFNSQIADLIVSEIKIVKDHIRVKGGFGKVGQKIKTLKIENHCLVDVSDHSNIIQIDLNDRSRDFRMHGERTEIRLEY